MQIAQLMEKMIVYSDGNVHDIDHFVRVWAYAKTIGELKRLDAGTQLILEIAAITHDIACPLCREKYGNTNGKHQEEEGMPLVRAFLADSGLDAAQIDRVAFLVGHHHTFKGIDGADWQILVEADYIANAIENGYDEKSVRAFLNGIAKTPSGQRLIQEVLLSSEWRCQGRTIAHCNVGRRLEETWKSSRRTGKRSIPRGGSIIP